MVESTRTNIEGKELEKKYKVTTISRKSIGLYKNLNRNKIDISLEK